MDDLLLTSIINEMSKTENILLSGIYIFLMILSVILAKLKNRSVLNWAILSFLLTPMLSLVPLFILKSIKPFKYIGDINLSNESYKNYLKEKYLIEIDSDEKSHCLGRKFTSPSGAYEYCMNFDLKKNNKHHLKIFFLFVIYLMCAISYVQILRNGINFLKSPQLLSIPSDAATEKVEDKAEIKNQLWTLEEDTDDLTGKKFTYVVYDSYLDIPNYKDARVEVKVLCEEFEDNFVGIKTYIPHEIITSYGSPPMRLAQRVVLNNGTSETVQYRQDEYSNVIERDLINKIELYEWRSDNDKIFENQFSKIKNYFESRLSKKGELKFNNGITHIIDYDNTYQSFSRDCWKKIEPY